jgi:hypothetical protein
MVNSKQIPKARQTDNASVNSGLNSQTPTIGGLIFEPVNPQAITLGWAQTLAGSRGQKRARHIDGNLDRQRVNQLRESGIRDQELE